MQGTEKELSRTESSILGALSKLDEFLLNQQVRTCSAAVPGSSRNNNSENREPAGDCSLNDTQSEDGLSACNTSNPTESDQEKTQHIVTRVQEEIPLDFVRKTIEVALHNQPNFRSENIPAAINADQILLGLQQMAFNRVSAICINIINRISKLLKSLATTMSTIDCDATIHIKNPAKTRTNLPPLQKSNSLTKSVPSTQTRERLGPNNRICAGNNKNINNGGQTNSNSNNKIPNNTNTNIMNSRNDRKPRSVYPPCETCGKTNHSAEKCYFGANAANTPLHRYRRPEGENQVQQTNAQNNLDVNIQAAAHTLN